MSRLLNLSSAPPGSSAGPSPARTATAAAPSPNRLFTTALRMLPSNTYAAEHTSMQIITASWPGLAAAHAATGLSAFSPALQPMPTTSARPQSRRSPSSRISSALKPGVSKPVDETQHRYRTSAYSAPARSRQSRSARVASSRPSVRCLSSSWPWVSVTGPPAGSTAGRCRYRWSIRLLWNSDRTRRSSMP